MCSVIKIVSMGNYPIITLLNEDTEFMFIYYINLKKIFIYACDLLGISIIYDPNT